MGRLTLGRILTLDLGAHVGCAIEQRGAPSFISFNLPPAGSGLGARLLAYDNWLTRQLRENQVGLVGYECPIPRGKLQGLNVARIMHGLAGQTEVCCVRLGIKVVEASPAEIKKAFAGHGTADKARMMAECRRRGWKPPTEDCADAAGLYAYLVQLYCSASAARMGWAGNLQLAV